MVSRAAVFQFILLLSYFPSHCSSEDFFFNGFEQASNQLSLAGSTKITKDGLMQLTHDTTSILGHAFFSSPIPMITTDKNVSEVTSFSRSFILDILTMGKAGGHDLTFAITPSIQLPGDGVADYLSLLGCPLESGQPIQAWIKYNGTNITIAPLPIPKPSGALISYHLDLIPIFEKEMCVGITSSTGKLASSH